MPAATSGEDAKRASRGATTLPPCSFGSCSMRLPYQFQLNPLELLTALGGEGLGWGFFLLFRLLLILWEPLGDRFSIGLPTGSVENRIPPYSPVKCSYFVRESGAWEFGFFGRLEFAKVVLIC